MDVRARPLEMAYPGQVIGFPGQEKTPLFCDKDLRVLDSREMGASKFEKILGLGEC